MPLSISQLLTPQTAPNIRQAMQDSLVALSVPADKWRAGGVASTILTVASIVLAQLSSLIATTLSGFFLPTATGTGLQFLAFYVYGVTAPPATFATGFITLTNSGGGVYSVGVGQLTFLNPTTKQTYTNTSAFTVPALSTITVPIQCTVLGTVGNANPAAITTLTTPLVGVTCSNADSVVGSDVIGDAALRQLCLNSLGVGSNRGPRSAYGFAIQTAKNVASGAPVNINRWYISPSSSTGLVTIYVASPAGVPDPNDVLGVIANIEALARPDTVTVSTNAATAVNYAPSITVWCTAPLNTSIPTIQTAIGNSLTTFFSTYSIGGETATDDSFTNFTGLFGASVDGAIAAGLTGIGGKLISTQGVTDLALSIGQVAIDDITVNVRLIASANGGAS